MILTFMQSTYPKNVKAALKSQKCLGVDVLVHTYGVKVCTHDCKDDVVQDKSKCLNICSVQAI